MASPPSHVPELGDRTVDQKVSVEEVNALIDEYRAEEARRAKEESERISSGIIGEGRVSMAAKELALLGPSQDNIGTTMDDNDRQLGFGESETQQHLSPGKEPLRPWNDKDTEDNERENMDYRENGNLGTPDGSEETVREENRMGSSLQMHANLGIMGESPSSLSQNTQELDERERGRETRANDRELVNIIHKTLKRMGYDRHGYSVTKLLENLGSSKILFGSSKNSQFAKAKELCETYRDTITITNQGGRMRIGINEWNEETVTICPICHTSNEEAWIQCSIEGCGTWVHEVCDCVRHEDAARDDYSYVCPLCRREGKGDVSCFILACDCVRDLLIKLGFTDEKIYNDNLKRALNDAVTALNDKNDAYNNEFNNGIFTIAKGMLDEFVKMEPIFTGAPEKKKVPPSTSEEVKTEDEQQVKLEGLQEQQ